MPYKYICTKCGKRYYSATEISSQKNNICEYCKGRVDYTEEQKNKLKNSKLEKEVLDFPNMDRMWEFYYKRGLSNYKIAREIRLFNEEYAKKNDKKNSDYFYKLKEHFYKKFIK